MATEITVPKLGLTMTEANLVKWAVASGQSVTIEEIVAVIETDKVSFEIVAPAADLADGGCVAVEAKAAVTAAHNSFKEGQGRVVVGIVTVLWGIGQAFDCPDVFFLKLHFAAGGEEKGEVGDSVEELGQEIGCFHKVLHIVEDEQQFASA